MSKGLAVLLATILLLAVIVLVKVFDKDIRKSQRKEQGIIFMFLLSVILYVYAFVKMINGF